MIQMRMREDAGNVTPGRPYHLPERAVRTDQSHFPPSQREAGQQ